MVVKSCEKYNKKKKQDVQSIKSRNSIVIQKILYNILWSRETAVYASKSRTELSATLKCIVDRLCDEWNVYRRELIFEIYREIIQVKYSSKKL